jgi:hypothetical protein
VSYECRSEPPGAAGGPDAGTPSDAGRADAAR